MKKRTGTSRDRLETCEKDEKYFNFKRSKKC